MPWVTHLADTNMVWLWLIFTGLIAGRQLLQSKKEEPAGRQQRSIILKTILLFFLFAALIYAINAGIYVGLKYLFSRARPFMQEMIILRVSSAISSHLITDGSFPSGHASNAFMTAALFSELLSRKRAVFYSAAALVALSRVYIGVHYPSDIIAGSCLGITVTWLMLYFRRQRNGIHNNKFPEELTID